MERSKWQVTDPDGIVHLRTSDGMTPCGQDASGWSDAVTVLLRMGLVERCGECGERAPGLLHHVLTSGD